MLCGRAAVGDITVLGDSRKDGIGIRVSRTKKIRVEKEKLRKHTQLIS